MQRVTKFIGANTLTIQSLHSEQALIPNGIYTQCVRWKRKPIWLPTAKSKVFRVPKRPEIPAAELAEIQRLSTNYKTYMKSLRSYFTAIAQEKQVQTDFAHQEIIAKEDFLRCNEINNIWNAKVAVEREQRLEEERRDRLEKVATRVELKEKRDKDRQQKVDAEIKKFKEDSMHFITPENIDAAIKNALDNVVDRNYAIDINGQSITEFGTTDKYKNPMFNKMTLRYESRTRPKANAAKSAET